MVGELVLVYAGKRSSKDQSSYSKTLTDVENGIYVEGWEISSDELDAGDGWCIEKRRLRGGLSDGVDIVTVHNGVLSFTVVPTRGMGIWKGECQGIPLDWGSPIRSPVHPHYMDLEARGGLGWLDGFNEWVVRCGLVSFGAPRVDVMKDNTGREKEVLLTLHGRIANIPASLVKARIGLKPPFELGVEGVVYERTFFGSNLKLTTSITTTPKSNSLKISDSVENLRGVPDEMQLLYHCNYGSPFLEEGAHFVAPIRRVAPRDSTAMKGIDEFDVYGPPRGGFVEQVYFMELLSDADGHTRAMLVNKNETKGVSLSLSVKQLPYFTLWKNTAAMEDGYVTGLEPATGLPNPKRFERERNRVLELKPGEKHTADVTLSVHLSKAELQEVYEDIERIRGKTKPAIFKDPIRDFSLP